MYGIRIKGSYLILGEGQCMVLELRVVSSFMEGCQVKV